VTGVARTRQAYPPRFDFVFDMPVVCDAFVMRHS